jgi:hypothetical protein
LFLDSKPIIMLKGTLYKELQEHVGDIIVTKSVVTHCTQTQCSLCLAWPFKFMFSPGIQCSRMKMLYYVIHGSLASISKKKKKKK